MGTGLFLILLASGLPLMATAIGILAAGAMKLQPTAQGVVGAFAGVLALALVPGILLSGI
jgi:hypothetical protein